MSLQVPVPVTADGQPTSAVEFVQLTTEEIGLRIVLGESADDLEQSLEPDLLLARDKDSWKLFVHTDGDHQLSVEIGTKSPYCLNVEDSSGKQIWKQFSLGSDATSQDPRSSARSDREPDELRQRLIAVDLCPHCQSGETAVLATHTDPSSVSGLVCTVEQTCGNCFARWDTVLIPVSYQMRSREDTNKPTGKMRRIENDIAKLIDLAAVVATYVSNAKLVSQLCHMIRRVTKLQTSA